MKITDCKWEIDNIGKKTLEIECDSHETFNAKEIEDAIKGYEYIVIKVIAGNMNFVLNLPDLGFKYIESQYDVSKRFKEFNYGDTLIKILSDDIHLDIASSEEELDRILTSMTKDMFSTDRIYLDSQLGPDLGLRRYRNWVRTEFQRGSTLFDIVYKENNRIGFGLTRINNGIAHGLLGGIYEKYQNEGFGILTPSCPFLLDKNFDLKCKKLVTSISSNNMPVLQFYNYLNFKVDNIKYVYIKHNS